MTRVVLVLAGLLSGCAPSASSPATTDGTTWSHTTETPPDLPGHNECLPPGEEMSAETCLAVVEHDGRMPTESFYKAPGEPPDPDPRLDDPDYAWLSAEVQRCTCTCCHTSEYGGPGVYHWDMSFEPMWIDSASSWSLKVLAGMQYSDDQVLPTDDPERLEAVIEKELDRRDAAFD